MRVREPKGMVIAGRTKSIVMIVDHDAAQRGAVADLLWAEGYDVVQAEDAAAARALLGGGIKASVLILHLATPDALALASTQTGAQAGGVVLLAARAPDAAPPGAAVVHLPYEANALAAVVYELAAAATAASSDGAEPAKR